MLERYAKDHCLGNKHTITSEDFKFIPKYKWRKHIKNFDTYDEYINDFVENYSKTKLDKTDIVLIDQISKSLLHRDKSALSPVENPVCVSSPVEISKVNDEGKFVDNGDRANHTTIFK